MDKRYILILGGEFSLRERVLAGALRAAGGMQVLTMAKNRTNAAIKFFDGYLSGDVADENAVLNAVKAHEASTGCKPAAAIPMNDFTVRAASLVAEHYKLQGNSRQTIHNCRDKFVMKQLLEKAGLPVPRFAAFSTLEELRHHIRDIGLPVVIKPREMAGSLGVLKITREEEIEPSFARSVADVISLNGESYAPEDLFQVEEYIPSLQEVSVEVINQGDYHKAIAVTDKYLGEEPHFVEVGHSVPSVHASNAQLRDIAERACHALGIHYGVAHFEARITPAGEIKIIEVGARTGGDTIMDLVERSYGINPYELHVASHLNALKPLAEPLVPKGLSAVAFIKAPVGTIEKVTLPASLPDHIVNMQITAKPLDTSKKLESWKTREGSVEFFWPSRKPETGFNEHLRTADDLATTLFTLRQA
ncbi:D-alanine--D-alanine ligase [Pantoea ananatis]|uniref:ATP-grasp domain-containing protein n=1 Tax=Pantoea ananas TaxID=553 RepID=UPI0021F6E72D|nr:ATP-grasp domain-containing protein [Pantoea ananatis]MCW0318448.1 D-alanine--D-alanine ligase [Pantoea ananatis]MCW0336616.1 D-alanine--D-alanine ligase [Pantoea ananatis]MCW0384761.1 D-alanine--D-alanine ligase [Pantoea ananatis]MCW0409226.1 D-alanine--D-alanine ligase [Pantoea ananatis]MCW0429451.1 D-alanine--D-alanine ligase [Pantoea ananatis]